MWLLSFRQKDDTTEWGVVVTTHPWSPLYRERKFSSCVGSRQSLLPTQIDIAPFSSGERSKEKGDIAT